MDGPYGPLLIAGTEAGLTHIRLPTEGTAQAPDADWIKDPHRLQAACAQLTGYLRGERRTFDLRLAPDGSAFQRRVWQALTQIPFGTTTSYGAIARAIGAPKATRAVGMANGQNPLPIVIPCHRVIAADGGIGGFSGGLATKRALLRIEGHALGAEQPKLL
ncbi:methylated-DNA--[protein]-cysteine S-methyltransferase [Jannaschia sp. AI_61]|nr:methylated-DNA--[protein]-cysteine S-methyltransferase [Jannaschia sp. AI_61]